jgi:hypothetical protein
MLEGKPEYSEKATATLYTTDLTDWHGIDTDLRGKKLETKFLYQADMSST